MGGQGIFKTQTRWKAKADNLAKYISQILISRNNYFLFLFFVF